MALATSSGGFSLVRAPRGAGLTFTIVGVLILAGYFGLTFLYDRVHPNPQHIYEALGDARFNQPLPENLQVTGTSTDKRFGERYVAIYLNTPVDPQGFEGNQAQISYLIFDEPTAARDHLEELKTSTRLWTEQEPMGKSGNRIERGGTRLPIAEDNTCSVLNGRINYCQILVGRVIIDVTSYLEVVGLGESSYDELAEAALAHLRERVPGVD